MADLKDVKNDKKTRTSIFDMAVGAIKARTDYEMTRGMDNI